MVYSLEDLKNIKTEKSIEEKQIDFIKRKLTYGNKDSIRRLLWIYQELSKYNKRGFITQVDFRKIFGTSPSFSSQYFKELQEMGFIINDKYQEKFYKGTKDPETGELCIGKYMTYIIEYLNEHELKLDIRSD